MLNKQYAIESYTHPREFPRDVLCLFSKSENDNIEAGPGWYENFVDTVARHLGQAIFYVLRQNKNPIIALPLLLINDGKLNNRIHSLSNYYTSLYTPALDPAATTDDLTSLLLHIKSENPGLHTIQLAPMERRSPATDMLSAALCDAGFITFKYFCFKNWSLKVQQNWEDYLSSREHRILNTLKRAGKKLTQQGGTLEIVSDGPDLDQALADYQQVYQASWKNPEPFEDFIPGLVRVCAARGWLRIGIARLNGRPIAAQIWIVNKGRASIFKLAYDKNYRNYSAGTQLTAKLLKHSFEADRVTCVDYLQGDDAYKKSWMSDCCERIGIIAYNPRTLYGRALIMKEKARRITKQIMKISKPEEAEICLH